MSQIGGMFGMNVHEEHIDTILGPLDIENVQNAISEEARDRRKGVPKKVTELLKKPRNDTPIKKSFIDYIKSLFTLTFDDKKLKNNFSVTLDNDEVKKNLGQIMTSDFSTNKIVSIRVGYRTTSKEAIMNRINGSAILTLNILNIIKLISRLVDNSVDGCGGLGTKCFYFGEVFLVFNELTLHMIKQGFQPIGQLNMANEFAYMTFYRSSSTRPNSPAPAYKAVSVPGANDLNTVAGITKMKKRSKKKIKRK